MKYEVHLYTCENMSNASEIPTNRINPTQIVRTLSNHHLRIYSTYAVTQGGYFPVVCKETQLLYAEYIDVHLMY